MRNSCISILLTFMVSMNVNGQAGKIVPHMVRKLIHQSSQGVLEAGKGVRKSILMLHEEANKMADFGDGNTPFPLAVSQETANRVSEMVNIPRMNDDPVNTTQTASFETSQEAKKMAENFYYRKLATNKGFTNDDVKRLQQSLNFLSNSNLKVDGLFGKQTIGELNKYMELRSMK